MPEVIYANTLDKGAYTVNLLAIDDDPSHGVLTVTDNADSTVIHRETIPLAYEAIFGLDIEDVNYVQSRVIEVVDSPEKRAVE